MRRSSRLLWKEGFVRSWWVLLFGTLCLAGYESASKALNDEAASLGGEIRALEKRLAIEQRRGAELQYKLQSIHDPQYVELVLIQTLGVVPKGRQKVCFERGSAS